MTRSAEVLIQAGHEGRVPGEATGARGPLGNEIDWTPIVANEATRVLRAAGISVIREDATFDDTTNLVNLALFIHFDGNSDPCATGASVGYKPRSVDPTLSDKPAADAWKTLYSRYFPFPWMPDNFTNNLSGYYGYTFTRTSIAELVIELGAISCPQQAAWLKPRLTWIGRLIAHFVSQQIGRGNIPDPGPFNPLAPEAERALPEHLEAERALLEHLEAEAVSGIVLDDGRLSECADEIIMLEPEVLGIEMHRALDMAEAVPPQARGHMSPAYDTEYALKAQLAGQIQQSAAARGLTALHMSQSTGLSQSEITRLLHNRVAELSLGSLLHVLNQLGHSVELVVSVEERAPEDTYLVVRRG